VKSILAEARAKVASLAAAGQAPPEASASPSPSSRKGELGFWLMAAATHEFVIHEGRGNFPVIGTIPDMTADTTTYVALQQLYAQQAASDLAIVQAYLRDIGASHGLSSDSLVSADELKRFCKNAHSLQRLSYTPTCDEFPDSVPASAAAPPPALAPTLASHLGEDDAASAGALYLLLRAAQSFRAERSRWPGEDDTSVEADLPQLKQCVSETAKELNLPPPTSGSASHVTDEHIAEFCRWGGAEMHAIASVMGGIASQEAIKATTHQYTPLNNTFIFNGASGTTATFAV